MSERKATVLVIDPLRLQEEINDPKFQGLIADGYRIGTTVLRLEGKDDREVAMLAIVMEPPLPTPAPIEVPILPAMWARAALGLLIAQICLSAAVCAGLWLR